MPDMDCMLVYFTINTKLITSLNHYVRQSLLTIWLKYRRYLPEQIPPCVVPCDVMKTVTSKSGKCWLTYGDLIVIKDGREIYLKPAEEIP